MHRICMHLGWHLRPPLGCWGSRGCWGWLMLAHVCCIPHPICLRLWKVTHSLRLLLCWRHLMWKIVTTSAAWATWSACNTWRPNPPNSTSLPTGYHVTINPVFWIACAVALILLLPTYGALLFSFQYAPQAHCILDRCFSFFSKLILGVSYAHACSVSIIPTLYSNASKSSMPVFAMGWYQPIEPHLIIYFNHALSSVS
jgi:hypothetical protein